MIVTDNSLYALAILAQKQNDDRALMEIIKRFEPKIKRSLQQTGYNNKEDLEQYIKLNMIKIIRSYDLNSLPSLTDYINLESQTA